MRTHLDRFGGINVRHVRMTTQQFVDSDDYRQLGEVDLLYVDGYHTQEQAKFDHLGFEPLLSADATVLFHDSVRPRLSTMYGEGRHYTHTVHLYMDELRASGDHEVFDLPLASGVTLCSAGRARTASTDEKNPHGAAMRVLMNAGLRQPRPIRT